MTYWLNDAYREGPAAIDVADRGFLLGDGVFETILVLDGAPVFLSQHLRRLHGGLRALGIDAGIGEEEAAAVIGTLAAQNGAGKGYAVARLTVSRGPGGRGLATGSGIQPTRMITVAPYAPLDASAPLAVVVARQRRARVSLASKWKTLAYVDNIVARREALAAQADDAAMLNDAGRAACATAANLFVIEKDEIKTPPISEGALPGVVRAQILCHARAAGLSVRVAAIEARELTAGALVLTNSLIGVMPARLRGASPATAAAREIIAALQTCYGDVMRASHYRQVTS